MSRNRRILFSIRIVTSNIRQLIKPNWQSQVVLRLGHEVRDTLPVHVARLSEIAASSWPSREKRAILMLASVLSVLMRKEDFPL